MIPIYFIYQQVNTNYLQWSFSKLSHFLIFLFCSYLHRSKHCWDFNWSVLCRDPSPTQRGFWLGYFHVFRVQPISTRHFKRKSQHWNQCSLKNIEKKGSIFVLFEGWWRIDDVFVKLWCCSHRWKMVLYDWRRSAIWDTDEEDLTYRSSKSKRFIKGCVFMAALVRPCFDYLQNAMFNGKIGICIR